MWYDWDDPDDTAERDEAARDHALFMEETCELLLTISSEPASASD